MRIGIAQLNFHTGNFTSNLTKIKYILEKAQAQKADLVIFPELAICGYPPRDFLEYNDFIEQCYSSLNEIAKLNYKFTVIIGSPSKNTSGVGKKLFNSAFVIADGKIKATIHKTLLPTYDVFDEYRYFEPNRNFSCITVKGKKIALTICEDLWNTDFNHLYVENPMEHLKKEKPDFIVNIAASPFHYGQAEKRKEVLSAVSKKYKLPLFYCNHIGGQTELIFDGGSMVYDAAGNLADELNYFAEDFRIYDLNQVVKGELPRYVEKASTRSERIYEALILGVKNYFAKLGFSKAILGLSGGIDSAVVLVIAAKALGAQNVRAVLMPSQFSTKHSIDDALELADNLGCPHDIIKIEELYYSFEKTLQPFFKGTEFGLAEENLQARIRAVLLMALSNKFGYVLLNTSNKSEAATGYGTLYGDMCGGISVLGDVYKTQVYELAEIINRKSEIIPQNIINKAPSAELRPNQKDSDSLPEYSLLDKILELYIEQARSPEEIIKEGFDEATVRKVLRLVNLSEYKRYQSPPILRVSPRAFGMGRRMPIAAKYLIDNS